MGALADCELVRGAVIGQPVNTISTLGFLLAGAWLWNRPKLRWVGVGLAATGLGSLLFHGPMPAGAEWAHDTTLAWLILLLAGLGRPYERLTRLPGLAVIAVVFAVAPAVADPVAAVLAAITVIIVLAEDRSRATLAPLALIGAAAVLGRLGATGGPLCDPASALQPHAVWHLAAAAGVAWWASQRSAPV